MKKRMYVVTCLVTCLIVTLVYAKSAYTGQAEKSAKPVVAKEQDNKSGASVLITEMDKVSYAIGMQIGQNLATQQIEVAIEPLMRGLKDALQGKKPILSQDEMRQVMMDFQKRMQAKMEERQKTEGAKNFSEGKAFLENNLKKKGVKELPSGLQYKVIKAGTGAVPTASSRVKTHYRGSLIDGTVFDSSYGKKPVEFAVRGVIKGWTEALQLMKIGAKWELYIPANLAYGERGRPSIPANSTLIFEIELLEIVK